MCVSEIVYYPDDVLRARAKHINDALSTEVCDVIEKLTTTMAHYSHCVGLAANQIGSDLDIFVADASKNTRASSEHGFIVMINAVIVEKGESISMREGCMSVPDLTGNVSRAKHVVIRGMNPLGEEVTLSAHDFEARVFQHEIDHLLGKVFLDRVSSARDVFARKTYRPQASN